MEAPRLLDVFARNMRAKGIELGRRTDGWYRGAARIQALPGNVFCDVAATPVEKTRARSFQLGGTIETTNSNM